MIKFFFLMLIFSGPLWAVRKTPRSQSGLEAGVELRALKRFKRYLFLAETKNREEILGSSYHQMLIGSYYRVTKRLRFGLFLQGEQGLRWDQDWRKKDGTWQWQKIDNRWDFSTVGDVTFVDKLGSHWLWEIKNRFYYYHSRQSLQLRTRPGLRYFILKDGKPLWQIYSEFEAYVPVNYGTRSLYEYWAYLGSLYQVTPRFAFGPVISYRERWFHAYSSFESKTQQTFREKFSSTYVGLSAVYNW